MDQVDRKFQSLTIEEIEALNCKNIFNLSYPHSFFQRNWHWKMHFER